MSKTAWIYTGLVLAAWAYALYQSTYPSVVILGLVLVISAIQSACLERTAPQIRLWLLRSAVVTAPFFAWYWIAPIWRAATPPSHAFSPSNSEDLGSIVLGLVPFLLGAIVFVSVSLGLRLIRREHRVVVSPLAFRLATEIPLLLALLFGSSFVWSYSPSP